MNMKKMRGAVDPLTLGWIVAGIAVLLSTASVDNNIQDKKAQQKQHDAAQQAVYQQVEAAPATVIPATYKAVE